MTSDVIAHLQSFGFNVYMRDEKDTWLYFTTPDGKQIGYLQNSPHDGFSVCTVHVPNTSSGTGYQVTRHDYELPTEETLRQAFMFAPAWAREPRSVVKWRDIEHFMASNSFNGGYHLVAPIDA